MSVAVAPPRKSWIAELPAGTAELDWIARSAGTVSTGGVVSTTAIVNAALPVRPPLSVAEQVTVVVPSGKTEPDAFVHVAGKRPVDAWSPLASRS